VALADKTRADRAQIDQSAPFCPCRGGDCLCGIPAAAQFATVKQDKRLAVEREILARQAAQWQAFGMEGLDQACAFELVDGSLPGSKPARSSFRG